METVDDTWEIIPEASSGLHSMNVHREKKENKGKNEWEKEEGVMKEKNDNLPVLDSGKKLKVIYEPIQQSP